MRRRHTKAQIEEAIAYWENELKKLDEAIGTGDGTECVVVDRRNVVNQLDVFDFVLSYQQVVHGYAYESKAQPPKKEFAGKDTVIGFVALPEKNDIASQLRGKPYESFLEEQMRKLISEVNHNNKAFQAKR